MKYKTYLIVNYNELYKAFYRSRYFHIMND